jgi:Cu(I)/Ag(I) efflux system periplasmic protein CusF
MKTIVLPGLLALLVAICGVAAVLIGAGAFRQPSDVQAAGVILAIDPSQGDLTLRHEPIASIKWPEMTMTLKVASPDLLERIKVGDKVRFTLHEPDVANLVTSITPVQP